MNKVPPVSSKLLHNRWQNHDYETHMKRLTTIKSALNMSPPSVYSHIQSKAKKVKQIEGNLMILIRIQRNSWKLKEKIRSY